MPNLQAKLVGCRFAERCSEVHDRCRQEEPDLYETEKATQVRCFLFAEDAAPLARRKLDSRSQSPPEGSS